MAAAERICPNCGSPVRDNGRFCGQCGAPIESLDIDFGQEKSQVPTAPTSPTYQSQTPTPPPVSASLPSSPPPIQQSYSSAPFQQNSPKNKNGLIIAVVIGLVVFCSCCLIIFSGLYLFSNQSYSELPLINKFSETIIPKMGTPPVLHSTGISIPTPKMEPTIPALKPKPIPTLLGTEIPNQPADSKEFLFENIGFNLDMNIAADADGEVIPAEAGPEGGMPGSIYPQFVQINFKNYADNSYFLDPQIFVYPAQEYASLDESASEAIESLKFLLSTRNPEGVNPMPYLPLYPAAQLFHFDVKYLEFTNGSGVRYLTQFGQDISPINNESLFYTFQGLTDDGQYYIAAVLPVDHPKLPSDAILTSTEYQSLSEDYQGAIQDEINWLRNEANASFTPDLSLLDNMVVSFRIVN